MLGSEEGKNWRVLTDKMFMTQGKITRKKADGEMEAKMVCMGWGKGWLEREEGRKKNTEDSNNLLKVCSLFLKNLKIFSANNIASLLVLFCSVFLSTLLSVLCFTSSLCRGNSA